MIHVEKFDKREWASYSADAHRIAFSEHKPADWDRIDFALLPVRGGVPLGYVTCREYSKETLYWQYGGTFPGTRSTPLSWRVLLALLHWCTGKYKYVTMHVENTNTAMLKMAMKGGFRITGLRNFKGVVLLEHLLELP